MLPGRHAINASLLVGSLGCGGALLAFPDAPGLPLLGTAAVLSGIQGLTLTAAIGGIFFSSALKTRYAPQTASPL